MSILVLNAGSSTLKFGLFDAEARGEWVSGTVDWQGAQGGAEVVVRPRDGAERRSRSDASDHRAAAALAIGILDEPGTLPEGASPIAAVGHRVVHGGTSFRGSVRVDDGVREEIVRLGALAPLHNPQAAAAIEAAQARLPGVPHVAVFDTAFFADLPRASAILPVPYEWHEEWGVRRFGFHGISHAYIAGRAAELLGRDPEGLRLVGCHLGNGCSATAVRGGLAVDTTMSFTPLDGLMMGTRSGAVDPGLIVHLLRHKGLDAEGLDAALNRRSGLLGVSGVSGDFRKVEDAANHGNDRARLALEIYVARLRAAIGALAATLGGLDALVFTAGVGENSATLRTAACAGLEFLGVRLDPRRNAECRPDADIAAADASVRVLVIHTREDLMIAREARRIAFPSIVDLGSSSV